MGHTTRKYDCEKRPDRDDSPSYPPQRTPPDPSLQVEIPLSCFRSPPLLPSIEINLDSGQSETRAHSRENSNAFPHMVSCKQEPTVPFLPAGFG